ncbi:MAG: tetratricopeptide repeat protein [Ruminiclostridium sp.]|nr:tetratricopeptide repeat protein [Ruminiclostridium sp.]
MALSIVLFLGAATNILLKGINAGNVILLLLSLIPAGYEIILNSRKRTTTANASNNMQEQASSAVRKPASTSFIKAAVFILAVIAFGITSRFTINNADYNRSKIINSSINQINNGDYKDAERSLKKLYETDKSPLIASNLASVYLRLRDAQNARVMLDAANAALFADEKQWFNYGTYFLQQKDYTSALSSFEKAIELNPGLVMAHLYAGTSALILRDLKRAQYHLEEAALLNPVRPDIQYYLGRVYTEMMDYKRAEECFKKAQTNDDLPKEISDMLKQRLIELQPYLGGENNEQK